MHVSHRALPQAAQGLATFKMPAGWSPNQLAIYGWCMDNESYGTVHAAGWIRIIHCITWVRLLWDGFPYESPFQWRHSEVMIIPHAGTAKYKQTMWKHIEIMRRHGHNIYILYIHDMELIWTCKLGFDDLEGVKTCQVFRDFFETFAGVSVI